MGDAVCAVHPVVDEPNEETDLQDLHEDIANLVLVDESQGKRYGHLDGDQEPHELQRITSQCQAAVLADGDKVVHKTFEDIKCCNIVRNLDMKL